MEIKDHRITSEQVTIDYCVTIKTIIEGHTIEWWCPVTNHVFRPGFVKRYRIGSHPELAYPVITDEMKKQISEEFEKIIEQRKQQNL